MELYNDDCLKVLATIPDESVDCVVTDCPYHIQTGGCTNDAVKIGRYTEGGGYLMATPRKDEHGNKYYKDTKHISLCGILNDSDPKTYTKDGKLFKHNDIQFSEWLPEVYRVLKPGTHCYIMINPRNLKDLWQDAENVGFVFQNLIVWDKGNQTPNKYYMNAYELILMLRKGRARNINNLGTKNILRIPNIVRTKAHPTEKPVELMQVLVENSTNENDIVMDLFMGVGGVGVACKRTKRHFIGIEIDERYFRIAEQRINENEPINEPKIEPIPEPIKTEIFQYSLF